jgi:S-formylglutathione hydrolase FrmB
METDFNLEHLAARILREGCVLPDLYIACGYNDTLVPENRTFSRHLESIGFPHVYEEGPGTHEWLFWNPYIKRGLRHALQEEPAVLPNVFRIEKDQQGKE